MAFSGQILDDPVSGERFVFRKTADTRSRGLGPDGPRRPILALAESPALAPAPRVRLPLDLEAQGRPAASMRLADEVEQAAYRLTLTRR
jgi:hypothetical protein